jgi:hypothetical protein
MTNPVFTYNASSNLKTSDNVELTRAMTTQPGNAKLLLDTTLSAGAASLDLAPLLSQIADPQWLEILLDGDGAQLKFDGVATFTVKAVKDLAMRFTANTPGPSGPIALEIHVAALVAAQRLRVFCVGL